MLVQTAPSNARPCDPENAIANKPVIPWPKATARTALDHEWLATRPFLVAYQSQITEAS